MCPTICTPMDVRKKSANLLLVKRLVLWSSIVFWSFFLSPLFHYFFKKTSLQTIHKVCQSMHKSHNINNIPMIHTNTILLTIRSIHRTIIPFNRRWHTVKWTCDIKWNCFLLFFFVHWFHIYCHL